MKPKYNKTYKSFLSTQKRRRAEAMSVWLKQMFCKSLGIPYRD